MNQIPKLIDEWINVHRVYTKAYSGDPAWLFSLQERKHELKQVAIRVSQLAARGKLLDIGTGPGYLPIEIAKKCPNLNITGVDTELKLLKDAITNAGKNRLSERINCIRAQAEYLPFADCCFDTITSTYSFHLWNEQQQGAKEIYRILKPGGTAMLLVGRRFLLRGWQYFTDWFTNGTISTIRSYCVNAGFKEQDIKIKSMPMVLQIIVTK